MKKPIKILIILCTLFLLIGCTSINKKTTYTITKEQIDEIKSFIPTPANNYTYYNYEDVIDILGKGTTAYPYENDKTTKIEYWTFKENNIEYFLDTIYFDDKLISVQSKIVDEEDCLEEATFSNYKSLEEEIKNETSYSNLTKLIGEGVKVKEYYSDVNNSIYAWQHDLGVTVASVRNEDEILFIDTADSLDALINDSTSCH